MEQTFPVLQSSFETLRDEPLVFLPKIVSTFLSSIWVLGFLESQINLVAALVSLPLLGILGMMASMMVASMVRNEGENNLLKKSFLESIRRWKEIVITSVLVMIAGFLVSIPASVGVYFTLATGSIVPGIAGIGSSLMLLLLMGYASYFLPITILERESFAGGLKDSWKNSTRNSREVTFLMFFSIALLGLALASSEYMKALGYMGFVLSRLLSSVVNTYLFVISPTFYLEK